MNWLLPHLAAVALAIVIFCTLIAKKMPSLVSKRGGDTKLELGILIAALAIGSFAIYGPYLLEVRYFCYLDIGQDTLDQYVLFYLDLLDKIRADELGSWNFNFGLGMSSLSYQSWILDPFNLILIPLGLLLGNQHLSLILTALQIVKILLCGALFNRVLTSFCATPLARIVGACAYAFCGYLMLWGQHYWLGTTLVVFTALLLASEHLLKAWSVPCFAAVALLSALAIGWSPYCGFMILLGLAFVELILIIARTSGPKIARSTLKSVFSLAAPVLYGCLMAGIVLIPYALFLFGETGRIASEESIPLATRALTYAGEFVPLRWIPMILSRLLGTSLISSGADIPKTLVPTTEAFPYVNCYELVTLGFSAVAIVILFQFYHWALTELPRKNQALVVVATLLVVLYCCNNFLPALSNVFAEPKYRGSFVLATPVCIALAIGWEKRIQPGKVALPPLVAGALISFAILLWSLTNTVNGRWLCAFNLVGLALFCALSLKFTTDTRHHARTADTHSVLVMTLALILVGTSVADGFFVTNNRIAATAETFPEATEPNVASSTMTALEKLGKEDPSFYRVEKTYSDWTWLNDSLVEEFSGVSAYNSTNDGDVLAFYRAVWPSVISMGPYYQVYANDTDVNAINDMLGIKYLLSKKPLSLDSFELKENQGVILVYENPDACVLRGFASTTPESAFFRMSLDQRRETLATSVVVPDNVAGASESSSPGKTVLATDVRLYRKQDTVTAEIVAPSNLTACLAIPYTGGWHVFVDGHEVPTFRGDIGFIGFEVPEGQHHIEARYTVVGREIGAAVTIAGILCAALCCTCLSRFKKHHSTTQYKQEENLS
ncbi:YfhO family protein [Adlercreutzia sp. ZJ141]|uniref:YfhO family protein n=1 Tax=Adlercreutzia sp. ZJ141 TaxID=2709406 RepID=UPI0013E9C912|nr:YfhO family protein [Adlercreutzia sp. ZJ141]